MISVSTGQFSGPLALLLSLIEKEKMDITQISLAKIADEYIAYLETVEDISPEQIADFLLVAAKLLYIKSKALLSYLSTPEQDEEAEDLERQLRMYQEFLTAASDIEKILAGKHFSFAKEGKGIGRQVLTKKFYPPKNLLPENISSVYEDICNRLQFFVEKLREERLEKKISIDERIAHIRNLVSLGKSFSFRQIVSESLNRTEVIVNFLALLELAKQRELSFSQAELFGDILIDKLNS